MPGDETVSIGLVGVGGVASHVHFPAFQALPKVRVAAIADRNAEALDRHARGWPGVRAYSDAEALFRDPDIHAVVVATPNVTHRPLVLDALRAGKHVLCEKPLAMNGSEAGEMLAAARSSGLRHMVAFTYRFVPAMRYLKHILARGDLGQPMHFRSHRLQDWKLHGYGWRQWKDMAGSGELADMASHRIDYGRFLLGEMRSVCGLTKRFLPRDVDRNGLPCRTADTDDWVAFLAEYANGVTGAFESSKVARGHGLGTDGYDRVEVNGSEGSAIYQLRRPFELRIGRRAGAFEVVKIPKEFWKLAGSPRTPEGPDAGEDWKQDQAFEFVSAIREAREARPSFEDGLRCQIVIDAVLRSVDERRWVEIQPHV